MCVSFLRDERPAHNVCLFSHCPHRCRRNPSASRYSPRKTRALAGVHLQSRYEESIIFLYLKLARISQDQSLSSEGPVKKPHCSSTFDSGRWNSTIFPKYHPNQRDDVALLDNWITERSLFHFSSMSSSKYL